MQPPHHTLYRKAEAFAVCRLAPDAPLPAWATQGDFWSVTRTHDELSVICPQAGIPHDITATRDWVIFQVAGPFDFEVTGVLADLSAVLARAGVVVLAVATYDTDYLLVKATQATQAEAALTVAGHHIEAHIRRATETTDTLPPD